MSQTSGLGLNLGTQESGNLSQDTCVSEFDKENDPKMQAISDTIDKLATFCSASKNKDWLDSPLFNVDDDGMERMTNWSLNFPT